MTVKLVSAIQNFMGESNDTKPTEAPVGSTFYEENTGVKFIWNGANWVEDLSMIYALSQIP